MKTVLIAVAAFVFVVGCSCKDSAKEETSVKEGEKTQEPQYAEQTFSPDHIGVLGVVIATTASETNPKLTLRVDRVLGYGSGAPAIAETSEIEVFVPKVMFDTNREAIESSQNDESALVFTLRSESGGVGSSGSRWVATEISAGNQ